MAPKPSTLILLATLAASSLVTPAMAAQLNPFGFLSLVANKKLYDDTSPHDIASSGVRHCALYWLPWKQIVGYSSRKGFALSYCHLCRYADFHRYSGK